MIDVITSASNWQQLDCALGLVEIINEEADVHIVLTADFSIDNNDIKLHKFKTAHRATLSDNIFSMIGTISDDFRRGVYISPKIIPLEDSIRLIERSSLAELNLINLDNELCLNMFSWNGSIKGAFYDIAYFIDENPLMSLAEFENILHAIGVGFSRSLEVELVDPEKSTIYYLNGKPIVNHKIMHGGPLLLDSRNWELVEEIQNKHIEGSYL